MILAHVYKLKPSNSQSQKMNDWLNMLRCFYNFCLRDRIEAYEQVRSPMMGNYSRLDKQTECCPLTCSVSNSASVGYPWSNKNQKRSAGHQQSSYLPELKQRRPWDKRIDANVQQMNLRRLNAAFNKFFDGAGGYPKFKTRSKFRSFSYVPGQVKIDQKISNQRSDYHWKVANKLCRLGDAVIFEDLNVKSMMARCKPKQDSNGKYLKNNQAQKRGLNRVIVDAAWGELKLKTKAVAAKLGLIVTEFDPNQLRGVPSKVTPVLRTGFPPQVTGGTAQDVSLVLADEPSNPRQLTLFERKAVAGVPKAARCAGSPRCSDCRPVEAIEAVEWRNGRAIGC